MQLKPHQKWGKWILVMRYGARALWLFRELIKKNKSVYFIYKNSRIENALRTQSSITNDFFFFFSNKNLLLSFIVHFLRLIT